MILASAQTSPQKDNIEYNLKQHYALCEKAIESNVQFIVFPELSLSGYEREDAFNNFFTPDDARLRKLKRIAIAGNLIIVVGAPIKIKTSLFIGSFILFPDGSTSIYTKQYLHTGEEMYYNFSFEFDPQISLKSTKISLGICADVENIQHVREARNKGSKIYVPSVFYSQASISKLHEKLSNYAKDYHLNILMSNFCKESYNISAGAKSAFWDSNGNRIIELKENIPSLLMVEKTNSGWIGNSIVI